MDKKTHEHSHLNSIAHAIISLAKKRSMRNQIKSDKDPDKVTADQFDSLTVDELKAQLADSTNLSIDLEDERRRMRSSMAHVNRINKWIDASKWSISCDTPCAVVLKDSSVLVGVAGLDGNFTASYRIVPESLTVNVGQIEKWRSFGMPVDDGSM